VQVSGAVHALVARVKPELQASQVAAAVAEQVLQLTTEQAVHVPEL